ncbi:ATP-binding protein, partial [Microbispora bryophytorum]
KATRADVTVHAADGRLTLTVEDNGVGIPAQGRRSGLHNLADRAQRLGGTLTLTSPDTGGARLEWSVPLT